MIRASDQATGTLRCHAALQRSMPRVRSLITFFTPATGLITACVLLPVAACPLPPSTIQTEEATAPAVFREVDRPPEPPSSGVRITTITSGECPADNAVEPTAYFGGAIHLPLPAGVTTSNFVELMPGFARITNAVESTNCRENWPGGMINFMALVQLEPKGGEGWSESLRARLDGNSSDALRVDLLEAFGYPHGTKLVEGGEQSPGFELWVYEVPDLEPEPAKMLLSLWTVDDRVLVLVFECHPNAWPVLVNTFVDSAVRARLSPP